MSNSSNALSSIFAITRAASLRTSSSSSSIRGTLSTQCASTTKHQQTPPNHLISSSHPQTQPHRQFSTTPHPLKKQGGKGFSKNTIGVNAAKTEKPGVSEDPRDFTALEAEIERVVRNLREEISRIKPGGIDVEAVENARVLLKGSTGNAGGVKGRVGGRDKLGPGGGGKEVVKVGDLCQVLVKQRKLVLMVGEKEVRSCLVLTYPSFLFLPPLLPDNFYSNEK
ncbi:MAG: hypothetical protein LQ350_004197 [Teloschistes chrysophthalmus]|nr:MAG: hypothetical protein LQ350_004197 [Niorma chrysophthalma]